VIVGEQDGETLIVTNRHVVDGQFREQDPSPDLPHSELTVRAIGQVPVAGRVVWVAPDGLDIAVVSAPIHSAEAEAVPWDEAHPAMGDEVFSIGNPQGLGWTHTKGSVSQIRTRRYGSRQIAMIQTDTAINPGNSGGGLYDENGNLIGINTWTNDKRMSEGLSFAISFASVVQLDPPFVRNP
jgi:serine protease Do